MTDQEVQEIAERVTQGLEGLTSPVPRWLSDGVTLASFAVLMLALMFATVSSVNLRHQQSIVEPTAEGRKWQLPRWRWNGAASDLWWSRAQWALGATASTNQKMNFYGLVMLETLAKSNAASPAEKAILDTVWEASYTGMDDGEISRFLEDIHMKASQDTVKELSDPAPIATAHSDSDLVRDPADRTLLCREILAAQLKVVLDNELDRPTSPAVEQLAAIPLPPMP